MMMMSIPSAEGGVGITFVAGDKYADIEFLNSEEILAVTSEGQERPTVWELPNTADIKQSLQRIYEFFRA